MATTDIQQTAQFAAEASVSAAEAKQYLIEVQQGYQDISATTQEAINAATAAEAAKNSAETAEQNAATSAVASSESATAAAGSAAQAEEYKNDASEYALNKFTFYKTPSDPDGTIAGLAATTSGQSFRVAEGPGAAAAFKTYENQDGVAILQASQPGTAAVTGTIREFPTLAAAQDDADAGNILPGSTAFYRSPDDSALAIEVINNGGTLEPTGRKMPSKKYVDDAIDPYSPLLNITQASEFFPPDEYKDSGVEEAILDENKKILLSRKGVEWFFQKIRAGEISADQFAAEILSGNDVLISGQSLLGIVPFLQASTFVDISEFSDSGYDSATFSENNKIIVGIKGTTLYFSKIVVGDAVIEGSDFTEVKGVTDALSPLPESVTFLSPDEYADSGYISASTSENLVVIESLKTSDLTNSGQPDYIAFSEEKAGYEQVFLFDRDTGQQVRVTNTSSNETLPRVDGDKVIWQSDRETNRAPGGQYYCYINDLTEHSVMSRPIICGWGHSMVDNPRMLTRLQELTGYTAYNFGKSSRTSVGTAAAQGGRRAYYVPVGGSIPASGSVTLSPANPGPLSYFANAAASTPFHGSLAGIPGNFSWDGTNATFTRDASGDAVSVPVAVPFICDPVTTSAITGGIPAGTSFPLHPECINIFWMGRNNISQSMQVLSDTIGVVEYLKSLGQKVIILPDFNSSVEPRGSAGYANVMLSNSMIKKKYPELWCEIDSVDMRENFVNNYNPAYSQDVSDFGNDIPPTSLKYDGLHPSQSKETSNAPEYALQAGADVNAEFIYQKFQLLGWV
ncbi:TolB family protein [Klebsiella quasipneumoniae]